MSRPPLLACAVYISSSTAELVSKIATRASSVARVAIVDTFVDASYARSSVKIVGEPEPLLEAARHATAEALDLVDLSLEPHPAPHPRQGAVDMVAFMPLSDASGSSLALELASCDELATSLGRNLGEQGVPVLLYGARAGRTVLEARRGTSFFRSVRAAESRDVSLQLPPSFGPTVVPQRSGVAIVGSQTYVTNFNLQVEDAGLDACKRAADSVRAEFGVQVMALGHADSIEIGCNLQATASVATPERQRVLECVRKALPPEARITREYVVGFTPDEARGRAEEMLTLTEASEASRGPRGGL